PGVRYARLRATSPTYGAVTLLVVSEPREEQFYVMCLETAISGPRLIRVWKRRHWIEHCFRTLKHLLATGACQVQSEDAYYGHLVLRLMGCFVLFYTSRGTGSPWRRSSAASWAARARSCRTSPRKCPPAPNPTAVSNALRGGSTTPTAWRRGTFCPLRRSCGVISPGRRWCSLWMAAA